MFLFVTICIITAVREGVCLPFIHLPVIFECAMVFHNLIEGEQNHQQLPEVFVHYLQTEHRNRIGEKKRVTENAHSRNKNDHSILKTNLEMDT